MVQEKLRYIMYPRKSSEDEDRQVMSIDGQISELRRIAMENSLHVVRTLSESKSAKDPGRKVFNEMLQYIEKGGANAILTWKLDRLARNFDDGGRIIGMLQRGVIREIRTFERTYLPCDNVLMMAVEFGMANQYVRDLSTNVRRGIREKVRRGIFCGKAPPGYLNDPKTRTIEPHPKYFKKVQRIFRLFATARYSLTAIQRTFAEAGIVGNQSGKPLALSSIGQILNNPLYYGAFLHKGELHQGIHVPMVSKQTFDDIQKALILKGKPRKQKQVNRFLFLNFARCATCEQCITAERHEKKTGRIYDYYRCTHRNQKRPCSDRHFLRADRLAAEVKRNVGLVSIPDSWAERLLALVESAETDSAANVQIQFKRLRRGLDLLKSRIDRINTGFADGSLDIEEFKELKNPLIQSKIELEQNLMLLERGQLKSLEPFRELILQANQAYKLALVENWVEMKLFLQKVSSNRLLRAESLTVCFIKPWNLLAETVAALQGVSDDSARYSAWCRFVEAARTFFE